MPTTTITSTSELLSWVAAIPADMGGAVYRGEMTNTSEYILSTTKINLAGHSNGSIELTAAAGHSFRSGVRSGPMFYNPANGVGIRLTGTTQTSLLYIADSNVAISDLQFQVDARGRTVDTADSAGPVTVNNCIISNNSDGSGVTSDYVVGNSVSVFNNCVIIKLINSIYEVLHFQNGAMEFNFCDILVPTGTGFVGEFFHYGAATTINMRNCAIFGFPTNTYNNDYGALHFTNCRTDATVTTPTSITFTGGLVYADQFVSTTNDFRVKAGSGLINAGVPVGGITQDVTGLTRSVTTPTIGAYEFSSGAGGGGPGFTRFGPFLSIAAAGYGIEFVRALGRNPKTTRRGMLLPRNWRR